MKGTFGDGCDRFKRSMGSGQLRGTVEVDQVYAHYQHDPTNDLHHPDGGGPNYLTDPLFQKGTDDYMRHGAEKLITEEGSEIESAWIDNMEDLSNEVYLRAPWEFNDLRNSGHPIVESDGETIYDRAPVVPRLTEDQLKEKAKLSRELDPDRYTERGAHIHAAHTSALEHKQTIARELKRASE